MSVPPMNTSVQLSTLYTDPIPSNCPPTKSCTYSFFVDHVTILFMVMRKSFGDS